jgi:membrane protein DedA with SNARE-associated domain
VFEWIVGIITRLGYTGVAALTFLEHLFPPIPSELVLPLAGYVTGKGDLTLAPVILLGSIGSLAGATVWYVIGKRIGETRLRAWIEQHGRWLTLSTHDVDRANDWFQRRGKSAVLIGRLMPGVRTFVSLPAGFSGMGWISFLLYSALGTVAWTAALVYAGAKLQQNFELVSKYIDMVTNGVLVLMGAMLLWRYVRCWLPRGRGHDAPCAK